MRVLNYYKTLNRKNGNMVDRLYFEDLPAKETKEYKGLLIWHNYIIKDNIIIAELVKPSKQWIDDFLNKGANLGDGAKYFNYDKPTRDLSLAKGLLEHGINLSTREII